MRYLLKKNILSYEIRMNKWPNRRCKKKGCRGHEGFILFIETSRDKK
jgi:hypothetical protein